MEATLSSWLEAALAVLPAEAGLLLLLALAVSSIGFYRVVYFVSIGYAFSITAMALASAWLFAASLDLALGVQCALLALYGLRLGGYLLLRERSPAYSRELEDVQQRGRGIGVAKQLLIWWGVALLYLLLFSPCLLSLAARRAGGVGLALWSLPLGLALMLAGLGVETLADRQKSAFKRRHPDRFCNVGLYRMVRCPNYLGEIVFWLGQWLAGLAAYEHWVHWLCSLTGLVCIVLIMMGSTKRLERKQEGRYGGDPAYRAYTRTVPVLFPLVPIYTLKNVRVYLE